MTCLIEWRHLRTIQILKLTTQNIWHQFQPGIYIVTFTVISTFTMYQSIKNVLKLILVSFIIRFILRTVQKTREVRWNYNLIIWLNYSSYFFTKKFWYLTPFPSMCGSTWQTSVTTNCWILICYLGKLYQNLLE